MKNIRLSKHQIYVLLVLLIGLGLRIAFVIHHPPQGKENTKEFYTGDSRHYHKRTLRLINDRDKGREEAFYPPGTHYFYAPIYKFFPEHRYLVFNITQVVLSLLTCILIYLTTKLIFNKLVAAVAVTITSFNVLFILYVGNFLSELPFIFFISLTLYLLFISLKHPKQSVRLTLVQFEKGTALMAKCAPLSYRLYSIDVVELSAGNSNRR